MGTAKFKDHEWFILEKTISADLKGRSTIEIQHAIPPTEFVGVYGITEEQTAIPVQYLSGNGRSVIQMNGFEGIEVDATNVDGVVGMAFKVDSSDYFELLDDLPAPEPVEPLNILAKLRQEARRQMGATRESFLQDDVGLPGYEIPDGVDAVFEEDDPKPEEKEKKKEPEGAKEPAAKPAEGDGEQTKAPAADATAAAGDANSGSH